MIPKLAYILYCVGDGGLVEMIEPKFKTRKEIYGKCPAPTNEHSPHDLYMYDYHDVVDYVKKELKGRFHFVLISKVIDCLHLEVKSKYDPEDKF